MKTAFDLSHPIFKIVQQSADHLESEAYVIGGFVRDLVLNRPSKDIDIVTVGSGIALAEEVAKRVGPKTKVSIFKNFWIKFIR